MQSYPSSEMDGQFMTSFPSTTTATGKTGLRPRGRGAHVTHSATMGRTGVTTPRRREISLQQQHQSQPPPVFALHPSVSSSGGGGDTNHGRTARSRGNRSSATWTSSSDGGGGGGCDLANLSDTDDVQDRSGFVAEYNRLAGKHGIRLFVPDDYLPTSTEYSPHHRQSQHKRAGWFSRTFLRQPSAASSHASGGSSAAAVRCSDTRRASHKRSVSDLAIHIIQPIFKRDSLKGEDLQSLVRLCGKSILYLPSEYGPGSLVLPTCFRATAQYLVQHAADTRGVFRIPGSVRVVSALYDYYCAEGNVDDITSTTRCPNLPLHIKATTHDVASTFKRLLSGLPGGILGSLPLLDALVAIHSQLKGDPEVTKTKQTKLRARLIALAIGSVKSQFRRELICAVFGLLCLVGRAAETAPREDEHGRPLPTADLMGYSALGIVFGPLLVSDLLNSYTMRLAHPSVGLVLFPVTPPNTRKERRKSRVPSGEESNQHGSLTVDKIHVANSITEMLIMHWRDVVKHMRSLDILRPCATGGAPPGNFPDNYSPAALRPSASESFVIRKPAEWSAHRSPRTSLSVPKFPPREDMSESPIPPSPTPEARRGSSGKSRSGMCGLKENNTRSSSLVVQRQRPKLRVRSSSGSRVAPKPSLSLLSPTAEEPASLHELETSPGGMSYIADIHQTGYHIPPMMCYTAPMEVPHQRTPSPENQSRSGSYRDGDEPSGFDNSMEYLGDTRSEGGLPVPNDSDNPSGASPAHHVRRRAYSHISAKGSGKNVFRSSIPEPSTPPYNSSSFRGSQTRSSIPKPATAPLGKRGTASEDQAMASMSESKGKASNTRSNFRLRVFSDAERLRIHQGDDLPKDVNISTSESQRPEKRPTRRLLKGSRSSHSSYGSTVRSAHRMHGQGEDHDTKASDAEGSTRQQKSSIFRHLHRSERSSEPGEPGEPAERAPSNIPPVPPKSRMRLSFHLRKSASESGAGSQERPRPPRSVAGSRSEDQHQHEKEIDGKKPHGPLTPMRGRGRSSRRVNQSSISQAPSVEEVIVGGDELVGSRAGRGISINTRVPTSPTVPGATPTTPSRIPIPHRQAHSGAGRSRGGTKGKETSGATHANRGSETPRDDKITLEDNQPSSTTPATPPQKLNKDLNRVQTPIIPTRTSSVNRYSKSSVGRTPFPAMAQPVPTTPAMESPSRRPRGPTGSSVKAMAAMFENNSTSSVSPLKPPVPVFGIPTPIVQGKEKKKKGSNSSLVGEYTVNSATPSRTGKQTGVTGSSKKKPFSFSPVKKSSEAGVGSSRSALLRGSTDSRGSTEDHSEQSWVTVVPCSVGGSGDVEADNVVSHPTWEDPEVFWTTQDGRVKNKGDDGSQKTQEETEDQDGSVRITRPLASEEANGSHELESKRSEKSEPSRGRRLRSTVSGGSHPQLRVVASVMTPPRLRKTGTGSLSGLRSLDKVQMKGSPAEPEVDLSTAVASSNLGSHPQDSAEKVLQYQASVGSDPDRLSSETQRYDRQEGGEATQDRVSFLPPVRFVSFSDLDLEAQRSESSFDLSTSQNQGVSQTPMLNDIPTTGELQVSSPAMEVPYSSFMGSPQAAAEPTSIPRTKAYTISTTQDPPSVSRKTTGASSSRQPSPQVPKGVRASPSNAALHIQIGKLQKYLYNKTEEVKHLCQQLEMKQDNIHTLRKRCAETESECKMWRQRAEVAERRVATFQRITANMRNRRMGEGKDVKGKGKMKEEGLDEMKSRQLSGDMHTEDEGIVAERIRAAIHGGGHVEDRGIGQGLDGEDEFWPDGEDEDEFLIPPGSRSREYLSHRRPVERDISDVGSSLGSPRPISRDRLTNKPQRHQKKSSSSNYFDYYLDENDQKGKNNNEGREHESGEKDILPSSHGPSEDEDEGDHVVDEDGQLWYRESMDDEDDEERDEGDNGAIDVDIDDDNRSYTTASTNRTRGLSDGLESASLSSTMHVWIRAVQQEEFVHSDERAGDCE